MWTSPEAAIINALYAATTTTGRDASMLYALPDGSILYALPVERLPAIIRTYGWFTP